MPIKGILISMELSTEVLDSERFKTFWISMNVHLADTYTTVNWAEFSSELESLR